MVRIRDKHFTLFISEEQIQQRIRELAEQIDRDYYGRQPLFIGILNGSFIFAADLFRALTIEAEISFVKLASYNGTASTGNIVTAVGLQENIQSRHVIIVEDIVDSGLTLSKFLPVIWEQQPATIKIASLLTKPSAMQHAIQPDYTGFEMPERFVIGYGLDYNGLGRNLPGLYVLADQ